MTRGSHSTTLFLVALAAAWLVGVGNLRSDTPSAAQSQSPQSQATFRTAIDLVRVDVLVSDKGRPVANLSAEDFEVLDNGVAQAPQLAGVADGVTVVLVLDTSASVAGEKLKSLVAASEALVAGLRPADHAALITFSERVMLRVPLASVTDRNRFKSALQSVTASGRTAMNDALVASSSLVVAGSERSLVLLFSDGEDTASWLSREAVRDSLKRCDAVVYAIPSPGQAADSPDLQPSPAGIRGGSYLRRFEPDDRQEFLASLATETGGQTFEAEFGRRLEDRFRAILQEFRARYLLTYEPKGVGRDDGWHTLKVNLKSRAGTVNARAGYFADRPTAPVR